MDVLIKVVEGAEEKDVVISATWNYVNKSRLQKLQPKSELTKAMAHAALQ